MRQMVVSASVKTQSLDDGTWVATVLETQSHGLTEEQAVENLRQLVGVWNPEDASDEPDSPQPVVYKTVPLPLLEMVTMDGWEYVETFWELKLALVRKL